MKRLLKWTGLVLLAGVVALAAVVYLSFRGLAPIPNGANLGGVVVVRDGFVACYVLDLGEREVALVDACMDRKGGKILAALAARGLDAGAVKAILLTHGDADHANGALAFPGATVMALGPDVALAEGREARGLTPPWDRKPNGLQIRHPLADGDVLALGSVAVRVFAVPGHTKGSAAFLARGVLFLGDSAEATTEGRLAPAKRLTSADPERNQASLRALAARLAPVASEVRAIAPAHSGPLTRGLSPLTEWAR